MQSSTCVDGPGAAERLALPPLLLPQLQKAVSTSPALAVSTPCSGCCSPTLQ